MAQPSWRDLVRQVRRATGNGSNVGLSRNAGFAVAAGLGALGVAYVTYNSLFTVTGGRAAVMFNRVSGVKDTVYYTGTHFKIPLIEYQTVFDVRTKPYTVSAATGTRDLQTVDITLRILFRPREEALPRIYSQLGPEYSDLILRSIGNETLKAVVAQYNASQLITQREQVSSLIRRSLEQRALSFNVIIEDVSITHLTFSREYSAAVEAKQIAQQEAERAKYLVKQALQDKKSTIIKAEGEAASARMIGESIRNNPGYIELRQLDAAKEISRIVGTGNNKVYLDSDSLLLNITQLSQSGERLHNDVDRSIA